MLEYFIQLCLDNLNYFTITLFMAVESSFIPFPSEVVVPPAAWKAATVGDMNIFLVVFFATLGAVIGALVNYYLAVWLGRPIVYKFANSRFGHLCLIDEAKVRYAEEYFQKKGSLSTFVGRLVPAVRQLISIPAGLARMDIKRFVFFTALGAGAWNAVLALLGWYMSKVPGIETQEQLIDNVSKYSHEIGYCIAGMVAVVIIYLIVKAKLQKKR